MNYQKFKLHSEKIATNILKLCSVNYLSRTFEQTFLL